VGRDGFVGFVLRAKLVKQTPRISSSHTITQRAISSRKRRLKPFPVIKNCQRVLAANSFRNSVDQDNATFNAVQDAKAGKTVTP
jgi:hypothetical protein